MDNVENGSCCDEGERSLLRVIYIFLPIYNESDNVEELIHSIRNTLKDREYKIVVVNDGSIDNSLEIIRSLQADDLILNTYKINMNIGCALSTGIDTVIKESKHDNDVMIVMESDKTSDVSFIPSMIDALNAQDYDIIIASRYIEGGGYKGFPWIRMLLSLSANTMLRFLFPIHGVKDYTIFFRAYRMRILKRAIQYFGRFGIVQAIGFSANAELLIKLVLLSARVKEIPSLYNYNKKKGKSKIRIISTVLEYIWLIFYLKDVKKKFVKRLLKT